MESGQVIVRAVSIRNFRGIRTLDWRLESRLVCIVGPGDSCKTTVLDAIGVALSPRWSVTLSDSDFYQSDVTAPIAIEVTVADLPPELTKEDACGHWMRGVSSDGTVTDEPESHATPALTIRFEVDGSLEPTWSLVKDALSTQEYRLSASRRASLGCFHLDDSTTQHLRWTPGSALSHLTGTDGVAPLLTHAYRLARQAVYDSPPESLRDAAVHAGNVIRALGASAVTDPRPGLDPTMVARSALVLHDGTVPAARLGFGSQRLASLAFQLAAASSESIVLVDEIERGLEPTRLMHLLKALRDRAESGHGQVILTTLSPLVCEAQPSRLFFMRCTAGLATITTVPPAVTDVGSANPVAVIRSGPSSVLARRVVVCEGKTEVGLCRALSRHWEFTARMPLALVGTAFYLGEGSPAPARAEALVGLRFPTALLIDDDLSKNDKTAFDKAVTRAEAAGVQVIRWESGCSTEEQITSALPDQALHQFVTLAESLMQAEDAGQAIRDSVGARLGGQIKLSGLDPTVWSRESGRSLDEVRGALGKAAKKKGWFKDESRGEELGLLLVNHLDAMETAHRHFFRLLRRLRAFAYDEHEAADVESPT